MQFRKAVVVLLSLSLSGGTSTGADQDWEKAFREEAPKAWEALKGFYSQMEGEFTVTHRQTKSIDPSMIRVTRQRHVEFRINGKSVLIKMRRLHKSRDGRDQSQGETVLGANPQHMFRLTKAAQNAPYAVAGFAPPSEDFHDIGGNTFLYQYLYGAFCVDGVQLPQIIAKPEFVLKQVKPITKTGKSYVQVDYEVKPQSTEAIYKWMARLDLKPDPNVDYAKRLSIPHVTVLLDPKNYWCISEYELTRYSGTKLKGVKDYGEPIQGFPVLRHESETTLVTDSVEEFVVSCDFERLVRRVIPEDEFGMKALSVAEPGLAQDPGLSRLWLWLLVSGAFGLALVIGIALFMRKRFSPSEA